MLTTVGTVRTSTVSSEHSVHEDTLHSHGIIRKEKDKLSGTHESILFNRTACKSSST